MIRHDCAHVMAEAVQDLFPGTQVTIGPAIENGFYYDFFRNEPFSTEDLARIEARMAEIVKADLPLRARGGEPRRGARAVRRAWASGSSSSCSTPSPRASRSRSTTRASWFDLCRGPHGPSTGRIGAFKLTKVAGAYWRGDAQQPAAAAHLRHGVREQGRSSTPTCTSSRRRSGATTAGSAARWTCSTSRRRRRARSSGTRRAGRSGGRSRTTSAAGSTAPATTRSRRPQLDRPGALGALRPLGEVPREHVHARGRGAPPAR